MKLADVINAWYTLEKVGKPELSFSLYKGKEERIDMITGLIEAMPSFNDKNNQVVSREIKKLINLLPKTYYNENNPNNGDYSFNTVTLKGDDTITLRSTEIVKGDNREHVQNIKSLVNTIGRNMKADEYSVNVEYYSYNMQEIIIRFWWD